MSRQLQTDLLISTAVNNIASHHLSIKEIQYDPSFPLPFIAVSYCEDKKSFICFTKVGVNLLCYKWQAYSPICFKFSKQHCQTLQCFDQFMSPCTMCQALCTEGAKPFFPHPHFLKKQPNLKNNIVHWGQI